MTAGEEPEPLSYPRGVPPVLKLLQARSQQLLQPRDALCIALHSLSPCLPSCARSALSALCFAQHVLHPSAPLHP